jgi:hypothetical protein
MVMPISTCRGFSNGREILKALLATLAIPLAMIYYPARELSPREFIINFAMYYS